MTSTFGKPVLDTQQRIESLPLRAGDKFNCDPSGCTRLRVSIGKYSSSRYVSLGCCFVPAYHFNGGKRTVVSSSDVNSYLGVLLPIAEIVENSLGIFDFGTGNSQNDGLGCQVLKSREEGKKMTIPRRGHDPFEHNSANMARQSPTSAHDAANQTQKMRSIYVNSLSPKSTYGEARL
jgi:hypothetical protein